VITDAPPRSARRRAEFDRSEAITSLALPAPDRTRAATQTLTQAMAGGEKAPVRSACVVLLRELSEFYEVPLPEVKVLGVRPHVVSQGVCTYQLFGDYTPATAKIRVWMRTAVLGKVTSFRGLLNTLLHEFCHHLDVRQLGFPGTPHTRGFFIRIDRLYHLALDTPADKRRPLHWIKQGRSWRIDWRKLRG